MKSLEIVNKIQNDFNECFSRYDVRTMTIQNPDFYAKEWKQIKQDLEVLEILKEHLVLIPTGTNKEQLFIASDITNYLSEKDKDDFHKVKQWLEEN